MSLPLHLRQPKENSHHRSTVQVLEELDPTGEDPLCEFCKTRGIWEHLTTRKILGPAEWVFGFITDPNEVQDPERRNCAFCKMVFDVLPETAFAEEHRHMYRGDGAAKKYCSLRPETTNVRNDVITSFAVAYNFREYVSHSAKIFQNYRAWIGLDSRARRLYNTAGISSVRIPDTLDPNLIRTWIHRCEWSHELCRNTHRRYSYPRFYTLMINVEKFCLVERRTEHRYAALSYVWGQVESLQTTKANLHTLMKPNSLRESHVWNQLPRVIQDGITLTRASNIPFLWADRLCIVQDDPMKKHEQIARMDEIYFHATITLIPFTGKNADVNIPGIWSGTRAMVSSPVGPTSCNGIEKRQIVLTSSPNWHSLEYDSVYESRAWTLQEKVLSVRCLFFSRWGMWFQCLTSRFSDVEAGELPLQPENSGGMSLFTLEPPEHLHERDWGGWRGYRINEFLSFAVYAEWYSARKLTFQFDRVDAFRGILNRFENKCQQRFLWAHPEGHLLPISLLWIHVDVGRCRNPEGSTEDEIPIYQDYLPDRNTDYPTWSWIGWSARVSFRLALDMDGAGLNVELDKEVDIATQPAIDEDGAREQGIHEAFSPALFQRFLNRGFLTLRAPTISSADMCCGRPTSLHITTLDGTKGTFALAHPLYPFFQESSLTLPKERMAAGPCGMLFGIPFWQHVHYENHRFVLIKAVPGSISELSKGNASFRTVFEDHGGETCCIALLIWISGHYAERKGVAILDRAFWDSRNPVVQEYSLL